MNSVVTVKTREQIINVAIAIICYAIVAEVVVTSAVVNLYALVARVNVAVAEV